MARRRKGQRNRGKNVTIAVMVNGHETKHRGRTLAQALAMAKRERLYKGCDFKWYKQRHGRQIYRLPGRVAGADGVVVCNGRNTKANAFLLVYRPRAKYTGSGKAYQGRMR